MPHLPTPKMISLPLIPVDEHCGKCKHLQRVIDGKIKLSTFRNKCRCCKTGECGIFKGDAIYQYAKKCQELQEALDKLQKAEEEIELFKQNRNIGKKKTRYKTHGATVCNLRAEGKTLQQIADITGLAINTIRGILKESEE